MRVGTQGLFCPYLKTFVPPFLPTRLTAPESPRMRLPASFSGSYTQDEPNFPRQTNLILQKKDFQDLIKKSSTLQGPKLNSRTFKTTTKIQVNSNSSNFAAQGFQSLSLKFKTFSRSYEPWFCDVNRDSVDDRKMQSPFKVKQ